MIISHPNEAEKILPFISIFGKLCNPVTGSRPHETDSDFLWEREWRYASYPDCHFKIEKNDVFIGLCPEEYINYFEETFQQDFEIMDENKKNHYLQFIDPTKNIKMYAKKLIAARQRVNLKYSVI